MKALGMLRHRRLGWVAVIILFASLGWGVYLQRQGVSTTGTIALAVPESAEGSAVGPERETRELKPTTEAPERRSDRQVTAAKGVSPSASVAGGGETALIALLDGRLARFERRLEEMERGLERLRREWTAAGNARLRGEAGASGEGIPDSPSRRQSALVTAGLSPSEASDIVWRQGQHELHRLELRDQAIREGWYRTSRYYDELRALDATEPDLRGEIGDLAYDRYLFSSGQDNRIAVQSVIPGSVADAAGFQPGDVILAYGEDPVFAASDLQRATTSGELGASVTVRLLRDGGIVDVAVPVGPLGIRLEELIRNPDA